MFVLLDFFLCCPLQILNKCIVKPKTPDEKDSNKIIVEELKDIHEDNDSQRN